jgi:hypothetical protein
MTYLERKYPNEFALRTVSRNLNSTDWLRVGSGERSEQTRCLPLRLVVLESGS